MKTNMGFEIEPEGKKWLRMLAAELGISMSELIRRIVGFFRAVSQSEHGVEMLTQFGFYEEGNKEI